MDFAKFEPLSIRNNADLNEKWDQDRITRSGR